MNQYDKMNREASIKYNEALQKGNYESAVMQLSILSGIAEKEKRYEDKSRLEEIAEYIKDLFHIGREASRIEKAENKKEP